MRIRLCESDGLGTFKGSQLACHGRNNKRLSRDGQQPGPLVRVGKYTFLFPDCDATFSVSSQTAHFQLGGGGEEGNGPGRVTVTRCQRPSERGRRGPGGTCVSGARRMSVRPLRTADGTSSREGPGCGPSRSRTWEGPEKPHRVTAGRNRK